MQYKLEEGRKMTSWPWQLNGFCVGKTFFSIKYNCCTTKPYSCPISSRCFVVQLLQPTHYLHTLTSNFVAILETSELLKNLGFNNGGLSWYSPRHCMIVPNVFILIKVNNHNFEGNIFINKTNKLLRNEI